MIQAGINERAWKEGFWAGEVLSRTVAPYERGTVDAWSWHRGFIEGVAKCRGRRYSERPPAHVDWARHARAS